MKKIIKTFDYFAVTEHYTFTLSFREDDGTDEGMWCCILENRINKAGFGKELEPKNYWCGLLENLPQSFQPLYSKHVRDNNIIKFGPNRTHATIKRTSEVFTPLPLVDEILDKLPPELFSDPEKTFIDPACGDGNFLVRVIAYKIAKGSTAEQALSTTYGVDIMPDNVSHCRERLLTHAYVATLFKELSNKILPHLSLEQERDFGLEEGHDEFARQYNHIVKKNIVCHDALTYDYSFGEKSEKKTTINDLIDIDE